MKKPVSEILANWGQFIGGILTPVLVIMAWWSVDKQLKHSVVAEISTWTFELDKLFIEHPELNPYFESNQPISEHDSNYPRAVSASEFILDVMEASLETDYFSSDEGWQKWTKDMFKDSPILRKHLRDKHAWYVRLYPRFERWEKEEGWDTADRQATGATQP